MCSTSDLPQWHKQSFFHGYCLLKICWDVRNVLSYSLHYIIKCWKRHSAVLKDLVESFLSSLERWWNFPNWYGLLNMSCLLRLSTPFKSNFKALFSSRNRLRALSDAISLLASRCHVGHKNANRLHAHGSACTLVAGQAKPSQVKPSQVKPSQSSNWGRRLALRANRRPPVC